MNHFVRLATSVSATARKTRDFNGAQILPRMTFRFSGFRDGHCHPLFAAREASGPKLDHLESLTQVIGALEDYLGRNPECNWLDAGSVDRTLAQTEGLNSAVLDSVSLDVPIVVHASDHHAIWANTAALRLANLEFSAPEIENAHIDVDEFGKPTGMLHEWEAMNLIYVHQPKPTLDEDLAALERAQLQLLSNGIVAVQDAWIDPGMPETYMAAARLGKLKLRFNLAPRVAPANWRADLDFAIATRLAVNQAESPLLTCNTVKIFIDGVLGSETALMKSPYLDSTGCEVHGSLGTQIWKLSELEELALSADAEKFQLHFHAIGDAAVSLALDVIERVSILNAQIDRRPVLAHAEVIDPLDFPRMKSLGVIVCQQPIWAQPDQGFLHAKKILGEKRSDRMYPIKSLLEAGVKVSFGSDWPVSDPTPLPAIFGAVHRTQPGLDGFAAPQESISTAQAIRIHSTDTAFQLGHENQLESDWVELDTDISACTPQELLEARVLRVCVADQIVFRA